ncbi:hypothetical protein FIBSPDRAFT_215113 [Athelia psychrophila]|uniref:Uncharacterized protein n=1 Tax=Athelia psychrophila TaxID=1759441 RepID=A0A166SD01_9AGAM|nr:hypothetical protein FIBSPDRAFT_215113 [Fibularhizoctonia sp. CBS 109695]
MELDYDASGLDSLPAPTLDRWGRDEMNFEMDFGPGDIQSQSELLPFSSNACTTVTQTLPAGAPDPGRSNQQELLAITRSVSQKNRIALVPPIPPTNMSQRELRSQRFQEMKRLRKKKQEGINLATANALPPANAQSCRPAKVIPPCACPLCPRRSDRHGLIQHL